MGETQTLLLQIAADTSGFVALEKRFLDMATTVEAAALRMNRSVSGGAKAGAVATSDLENKLNQATAALRTQGAEIEALTAKLERNSAGRRRASKEIVEASGHVEAYKQHLQSQALAEQKATEASLVRAVVEQSAIKTKLANIVAADAAVEKIARARASEDLAHLKASVKANDLAEKQKTADARAESLKRLAVDQASIKERMAAIRVADAATARARASEDLAHLKASVKANDLAEKQKTADARAESLKRLAVDQASIKERMAAIRIADAATARDAGRAAYVAEQARIKEAMRQTRMEAELLRREKHALHDATRGLAGGVNALWMTYGQLIPLMAGFAISASIAASVKEGINFQYAMAFVGAVAETTAEKVALAGEEFKKMSLESQFSANEIAKGARVMVQAGFSLEDAVKALPQILKFATIGEIELSQAVEIAAGNMHAFGLTVRDLPHILDSTAKAAAISQTNIGEMGQALRQASTVAQQYGVNIDQMNALLAVLAERNIRGSAAGTAVRNMFIELDPHTERAKRAYKELGINVYDANNNFRDSLPLLREFAVKFQQYDEASRNRLSNSMFNERGSKAFLTAIAEGGASLDRMFKDIANAEGFLDEASKKINKTIKVEGLEALHAFQKAFLDAFGAGQSTLSEFLQKMKAGFESESFKNFAKTLIDGFFGLIKVVDLAMPMIDGFMKSLLFVGGAALVMKAVSGFQALRLAIIATGEASVAMAATTATAVTAVETSAVATGARVLGALGKAGLIGLILWGSMEIGGLMMQWDWFAAQVGSLVDNIMRKMKGLPPPDAVVGGNRWSGQGGMTPAEFAAQQERNKWKGGNASTGIIKRDWYGSEDYGMSDLTAEDYRKAPLKTWTPIDTAPMKAALTERLADLKASLAEERSVLSERHSMLQTYFREGLINEQQFYNQSMANADAQMAVMRKYVEQEREALQKAAATKGLTVTEVARYNKQITQLDTELAKAQSQLNKQKLADVSSITKPMLDFGKKEIEQSEKAIELLQNEVTELKTFNVERKTSTELEMMHAAVKERSNLLKLQSIAAGFEGNELLTAEQTHILNAIAAMEKHITTMDEQIEAYRRLRAERAALKNDWASGAMQGLEEYLKSVGSVADQSKKMFASMFKSLEDSLVNFVMTGKLDFKGMLQSWASDILRFVVQQQITKPLAEWLGSTLQSMFTSGGGGGGIGDFLMSLAGKAMGGGGGGGGLTGMASTAWSYLSGNGGWAAQPGSDMLIHASDSAGGLGGGMGMGIAGVLGGLAGKFGSKALGAGERGQKIGMTAGATGAMIGFQVGGPIGAAIGALAGTLIGKFSDPDGLAQRSAKFGTREGGDIPRSAKSAFGTFGVFEDKWFGDDMNEKLTAFLGGLAALDDELAKYLSKDETKKVKDALTGSKSYEFGIEHGDFSGTLGQIQLDRLNTIFGEIDPKLKKMIEGFEGTGEELAKFAIGLLQVRDYLKTSTLAGLDLESLLAMQDGEEALSDTLARVATGWQAITAVFAEDEPKFAPVEKALRDAFATITTSVPTSAEEWKRLAKTVDVSTEAGRKLFDVMANSAGAFLQLQQAITGMIDNIWSSAQSALGGDFANIFARGKLESSVSSWNTLLGNGYTTDRTISDLGSITPAMLTAIISNTMANYGADGVDLLQQVWADYATYIGTLNQATQSTTGSVDSLGTATANLAQQFIDARTNLADYLRASATSDTSPLTIRQKYDYAKGDLNRLIGLANGGGAGATDAINQLGGARDLFLGFSRQLFASSGQYNTDWFSTFDQLNTITGNAAARPPTAEETQAQAAMIVEAIAENVQKNEQVLQAVVALGQTVQQVGQIGDPLLQAKAQEQVDALNKIVNSGSISSNGKF